MTKLTDTQLIVLSSAAKHDEGLATRPANLNAAAATGCDRSRTASGLAKSFFSWGEAPELLFLERIGERAGDEVLGEAAWRLPALPLAPEAAKLMLIAAMRASSASSRRAGSKPARL